MESDTDLVSASTVPVVITIVARTLAGALLVAHFTGHTHYSIG
jgi:hypothetical protein